MFSMIRAAATLGAVIASGYVMWRASSGVAPSYSMGSTVAFFTFCVALTWLPTVWKR